MRIRIRVKPRSRSDKVQMTGDGEWTVSVRAPAQEGKANRALIAALAAHFSVSRSRVKILRGETSKTKIVEILPS